MIGGSDIARRTDGVVVARDAARMMVQAQLPAHGITTRWLRVITPLAAGAKAFALPRIGDFVTCVLDERLNTGVVMGAIFTNASPPPLDGAKLNAVHLLMDDGAVFEHDPDASATLIDAPAGGSITIRCGASSFVIADGLVTLTTPQFQAVKA